MPNNLFILLSGSPCTFEQVSPSPKNISLLFSKEILSPLSVCKVELSLQIHPLIFKNKISFANTSIFVSVHTKEFILLLLPTDISDGEHSLINAWPLQLATSLGISGSLAIALVGVTETVGVGLGVILGAIEPIPAGTLLPIPEWLEQ